MVKESWRKALKTGLVAGLAGFLFTRHKEGLKELVKETAGEVADEVRKARGRRPVWDTIEAHYTKEEK